MLPLPIKVSVGYMNRESYDAKVVDKIYLYKSVFLFDM